jgi:hypothetical protein
VISYAVALLPEQAENDREYRLVDQMMTCHAVLRDKYNRYALSMDVARLSFSLALNAFVFTPEATLIIIFGDRVANPRFLLGCVSVALLILSIVGIRVDWQGKSRSHSDAVDRLAQLKARYREARAGGGTAELRGELSRDYARTMKSIPSIPEKVFLRLKAHHAFKRLVSREVDEHPAVPAWVLSLALRARGLRALRKASRGAPPM